MGETTRRRRARPIAAPTTAVLKLEVLRRPGTYEGAFATGRRLMDGLAGAVAAAGLPAQVIGMPVLFDVIFATGEIADHRPTLRQDMEAMRRCNRSLPAACVLQGDSKFYISTAHTEDDVRHALAPFDSAVDAEAAFRPG